MKMLCRLRQTIRVRCTSSDRTEFDIIAKTNCNLQKIGDYYFPLCETPQNGTFGR